ncbi:MAG: hypothetical protein ABEJ87_02280 [Candidatus Nanohalobium sp.]
MDSESRKQVERAKELLMNQLKEGLQPEDRITLTLVLYGEKNGASITTDRPSKLEYFCDLTGLEYRKASENKIGSEYLISCDEEEIHRIESMGDFLGYPDSAVEFFNEYQGNRLNWKYIQFLDELLDEGKVEREELQYLYLVQFIPELSEENVREALEMGKEREESIKGKDRSSGLDIGSDILEEEVYSARNFVTQQKIEMLYIDFIMTYETGELENYFLEELPSEIGYEHSFDILMMLTGEKPGSLVMRPKPKQVQMLKQMCDELDLSYKITGGDKKSLVDRVLGIDRRTFKDGFFLSRDEKALNRLEESEGKFYGFSDRGVGEFLGYPRDSTIYYQNSSEPATEKTQKKIEELAGDKIEEERIEKLCFISYVPRPEEENILRAVKIGEMREEKLREMDKDLETSIGEKYIEEIKASDFNLY